MFVQFGHVQVPLCSARSSNFLLFRLSATVFLFCQVRSSRRVGVFLFTMDVSGSGGLPFRRLPPE
jgi:hypothetical protein